MRVIHSLVIREKTPFKRPRIRSSHNFNSIIDVCKRLGDERVTDLATEKMPHYAEALYGHI